MSQVISNWDNLTEDQKLAAQQMLASIPEEYKKEPHPASLFFGSKGWVKISNFIDPDTAKLLYHHVQLEAQRLTYVDEKFGKENYNAGIWGTFYDTYTMGDFCKYGDPIFDALLDVSTEKISELTGLDLIPNYTYHRLYTTGTELEKHIDREACEISITMCLGYDISNVDQNTYPDFDWPMFIKDPQMGDLPIHLKPGDMLIYRGEDLYHWREPFIGKNHAQVFMHYNVKGGKHDDGTKYDSRPILGLPPSFRDPIREEVNEQNLTKIEIIKDKIKIIE